MKPNQIIHLLILLILLSSGVATVPRSSMDYAIKPDARSEYQNQSIPGIFLVRALNQNPYPGDVYLVGTHMYRWHLERGWHGTSSGGYMPANWQYDFEVSGCRWLFIRETEGVSAPAWCRLVEERGQYKLYEVME